MLNVNTIHKVGYVFDPFMTRHSDPSDSTHPECPDRILRIYQKLLQEGLIYKMIAIKSRFATDDELKLGHSENYINTFRDITHSSNSDTEINKILDEKYNSIYGNKDSYDVAKLAAGSTIELVQNVISGYINSGVAIVRSPGHHGFPEKASGFCFFNNVALSAIIARDSGCKVCVVDFDIHYGDSSAEMLANKDNIWFFSLHRYDNGWYYPGTGNVSDIPNIINYPFSDIVATDKEYISIFKKDLIPKLKNIGPDIILVSAGFDAGAGDQLGGYQVTPKGFAQMTRMLKSVCPKIVLALEGGYNLDTISNSMFECAKVLFEK